MKEQFFSWNHFFLNLLAPHIDTKNLQLELVDSSYSNMILASI